MADVIRVVEARWSVQYNGSNSVDLIEAIPDAALVSETEGVLVFSAGLSEYTLGIGEWFVWRPSGATVDSGGTYSHQLYSQVFDPHPAA
jgi:hypothetical protein